MNKEEHIKEIVALLYKIEDNKLFRRIKFIISVMTEKS